MADDKKETIADIAAEKRERGNADSDWSATCAKCRDGDLLPECEFFGEPSGCNSPTYGRHPKSAPVDNEAALREALEKIRDALTIDDTGDLAFDMPPLTVAEIIAAALSAPPRNCDRFKHELDAQIAFLNEVWLISVDRDTMLERDKFENWTDEMRTSYGRWLLAYAIDGVKATRSMGLEVEHPSKQEVSFDMFQENKETISVIAEDIKVRADNAERASERTTSNFAVASLLRSIADRIVAAEKREREAADLRAIHAAEMAERDTRRELATGNAAALREATQKARHVIHCAIIAEILRGDDAYNALDLCNAALAEPPRNCDVGTAEEQIDRFHEFCRSYKFYLDDFHGYECTDDCPVAKMIDKKPKYCDNCMIPWSQVPYKEGGAK